jgi:hypothetical protein
MRLGGPQSGSGRSGGDKKPDRHTFLLHEDGNRARVRNVAASLPDRVLSVLHGCHFHDDGAVKIDT